jgi:hypothetical protein
MARDYVDIGPAPCEEECQQVGMPSYNHLFARLECEAFINQIRRTLGTEPDGARLAIKSFPHDFGSYMDVVCYYDTDNDESVTYAFMCESDCPMKWDQESRELLLVRGYQFND